MVKEWAVLLEANKGNRTFFLIEHPLTFGPDPTGHEGPEQEIYSGGSDEVCGMSGRDSELQRGNGW